MITIEQIIPGFSAELLAISRQTFFDAFAHLNNPVDMEAYAARAFTQAKIEDELNNSGSRFYFAKIDGEIAGFLKLNYHSAQTEINDPKALEVERIYVMQQYQGRQIGKQLLNFAIEEATRQNLRYVWLGVWEHNAKAIGFYKSKGFTVFGQHQFMLGADEQTDLLMKKQLP